LPSLLLQAAKNSNAVMAIILFNRFMLLSI
jgi:hypothetical protein